MYVDIVFIDLLMLVTFTLILETTINYPNLSNQFLGKTLL